MLFIHEEQDLRLRVTSMTWETEGVISLALRALDGSDLPAWRPGAHLDLQLPGVITRQYSLSGSPADRSTWRVSVLREPVSKGGSQAIHESVRAGDVVDVRGPRNNFVLEDAREYLFIAGGIGITPILPMVAAVAASGARWRLVYGGRTRSSMAFLPDLAQYGEAVHLHPQDELGLIDLPGLLGSPRPDTVVYCCGPEPLLEAVEQQCRAWPSGSLHVERFKPKPQDPQAAVGEIEFEVVCSRSGTTVTVPPGRAILEMLEEAGLSPDNSCREGICGTCETTVLDGIPEHRDSLLSDDERAAGETMMICVGRSLSTRLVLDL